MKVEVREKSNKNIYPYIGKHINHDAIVLICADKTGTVLHKGISVFSTGDYIIDWDEEKFESYNGEVVLSND